MGPEVARDEVVQAEPSGEAAGWGLHAWIKVGGLRLCQLLFCVSSVGKEGGRESPAGLCPAVCALWAQPWGGGLEGTAVGGGQASWVGAQGPRKQASVGTRLQAAPAGSQRHNGLLVRPWAGAPGGSGGGGSQARGRGGWPGAGLLDKALGTQACWPAPVGLSLLSAVVSPRGKAKGTGAVEGLGTQDFVSVRPASSSPSVSICLPAGTTGYLGCGRGPQRQQGHPPTAHRCQGYGRGRMWGPFQAAETTPSELRGLSAPFFGLLPWE